MTTIYISGPMSSKSNHNFEAFESATLDLRARGFKVISPHENDNGSHDKVWSFYMKLDLRSVTESDMVVVLPDWEISDGGNLEILCAKYLKLPIVRYPDLTPIEEELLPLMVKSCDLKKEVPEINILQEAINLVTGDRNKAYGSPLKDYLCSATMFNAWMDHKYPDGWSKLGPEDAIAFMMFVKFSREAHKPKRDSRADLGGYLLCYDMVLKELEDAKQAKT